jgi:hypothetical protein
VVDKETGKVLVTKEVAKPPTTTSDGKQQTEKEYTDPKTKEAVKVTEVAVSATETKRTIVKTDS